MIIKVPSIKEYQYVNELAKQVHELHVNLRPDLFFSMNEVIKKNLYEELVFSDKIFVIEINNKIIGYTIIDEFYDIDDTMKKKTIYIDQICIDEKYRRKGFATILLNYVKKEAKKNGYESMCLSVNQENESAINFYEKYGMKVKSINYSMKI